MNFCSVLLLLEKMARSRTCHVNFKGGARVGRKLGAMKNGNALLCIAVLK
jgi:hypothetical protein